MPFAAVGAAAAAVTAGTQIYGAVSAGNNSSGSALEAAKIQAQAEQNAEDIASQNADQTSLITQQNQQASTAAANQYYNTASSNLTPAISTGNSALYSLANLYGLNGTSGTAAANQTTAGQALQQLQGLSGIGGASSASAFNNAYSAFQNSPTYQFAAQQGSQALDRSAASTGTLLSGGQIKAAESYGSGLASQGLSQYTSNLQNLYSGQVSGLQNLGSTGESAASTLGSLGSQAAGTIAGVNNSASSTIGSALSSASSAETNAAQNSGTAQASGVLGSSQAQNTELANSLASLTGNNSSYSNSNALGSILGGVSSLFGSSGSSGLASTGNTGWVTT